MRILVIDDDPQVLQELQNLLSRWGHEVQVLDDGRLVQRRVDSYNPDWILTNLYMPEVDGLETILAMRRKRSKVRIAAMARSSMPCAAQCMRFARLFGAQIVMIKPVECDALLGVFGRAPTPLVNGFAEPEPTT